MRAQLRTERSRADKFEDLFTSKVQSNQEDSFAVRQLLDKTIGLLSTKDPIAYQQVQAMQSLSTSVSTEPDYDPSDRGEMLRELMRGQYDDSDEQSLGQDELEQALREAGLGIG
jgi:hypothetical protein